MNISRFRRIPHGIAWRARRATGAIELRRFRPRLAYDPDGVVVLLSPHWDDAVFNCWSLLTSDANVSVVNVFGGVPPPGPARRWDKICGAREAQARAHERIAEDAEALTHTGRQALNLALLDAEYRAPDADPSLDELDEALADVIPAASAVYAPASLGTNADHRLVRRYARAVHRHGIPARLYADLPYCTVHGWPHWVDGSDLDPHRDVDVFWETFLADLPELPNLRSAEVVHLAPERAEAKLAAMRAYRTQFPALDGGVGRLADPAVHSFEVFWSLDRSGLSTSSAPPAPRTG